jgi:hypothetical protein
MVALATASPEEYAWVTAELAHGVPFIATALRGPLATLDDSGEPQEVISIPQLFTGSI